MSDAPARTVPRSTLEHDWADLFPFDPYPQQVDGVERALATVRDDGYLLLEGACGTGKTLIALVAGLQAVAEGHAARVMAVTPVKQQLRQFLTEVRAINGSREEPVAGLVMVGKADLLPYARTGALDGAVHEAASELRETTAELVSRESRLALDIAPDALEGRLARCSHEECDRLSYAEDRCPDHRTGRDEEAPWYDPLRAEALCELVAGLPGDRLETAGTTAPYPTDPPHVRDVLDYDEATELPAGEGGHFDPFFARFLADEGGLRFGFDAGEANVLDPEALVRAAVGAGTCPHEALAALMAEADVLVGNYNHAFDPDTRRLTNEKAGVLDDETLLVVDEAHMIEERVRDLLSESLSLHALRTAHRDTRLAREYLSGTGGEPGADPTKHERDARAVLREFRGVDEEDIREFGRFLEWLTVVVDEEVSEFLDGEYGDWAYALAEGSLPEADHEIPLRDPEATDVDRLSTAAVEEFGPDVWVRLRDAGYVVGEIHETDDQTDRTPAAGGVGHLLWQWGERDHTTYFRELELEYAEKAVTDSSLPEWASAYNASLTLFNCIPREPLADVFDALAGGVVMSATLEPFSVYRRVTGLDLLEAGDAATDDAGGRDRPGRPVETAAYGLQFPAHNRASWVVDLPPFTYRNRGERTVAYDAMSRTRRAYASALTTVAGSPGNVLICMPSYAEAEWAVEWLRAEGSKPVLRDRSSDAGETDAMLGRFFQADGVDRVLVTSARGTVTEGVDYRGGRLHTACVVGVPYANTNTPRMRAVRHAYDREFDDGSGFEFGVQVPAVRKARQAIGRVLRGHDEIGVRVLMDGRYAPDAPRSVADGLAPQERAEFSRVSPDMLDLAIDRFWTGR